MAYNKKPKSGVKTTKVINPYGYRARRAAAKGKSVVVRGKPKPKPKGVVPRFKPSEGGISIYGA